MHLINESLVGQCEYTAQPKSSFWCHVIDTKGAVLLIFIHKFVLVLYLSYSFRHLVELKLLQDFKNDATGAYR